MNEYTAVVRQDGQWWIGWVEEVPGVNCQEASREELIESLSEALADILELDCAANWWQLPHFPDSAVRDSFAAGWSLTLDSAKLSLHGSCPTHQ